MSKSKKNVVSPDEIIEKYGADAMRLYEMFMGDFELPKPWDMRAIEGISRFLMRVWRVQDKLGVPSDKPGRPLAAADPNQRARHRAIQAVGERIDNFKFNTAIASLMELTNALTAAATREDVEILTLLISPFAPHLAEEMWNNMGHKESIMKAAWPKFDPALLKEDSIEYPVQVNGKLRATLAIALNAKKEDVVAAAKQLSKVQEFLGGQVIVKEIWVPGKMVNFVTKSS
jgi:leucyl-tRNA synthetase